MCISFQLMRGRGNETQPVPPTHEFRMEGAKGVAGETHGTVTQQDQLEVECS